MANDINYNISTTLKASDYTYDITISSNIAKQAIKKHVDSGGFIVCDENIAKLYGNAIDFGDKCIIITATEDNKVLATVETILAFLKDNGALRDSKLLALGGGIIGDITGFVASLYMRGISFIQMPTTLLSMVDSSVGGKTGVNFGGVKNNIGAFNQPESVIIDVEFLKTLTQEELLNGLVESIKIAATCDVDLLHYIKDNKDNILTYDVDVLSHIVYRSCDLKRSVVEQDEKEAGLRKILNFGHTIAHGIETDSNYAIKHGYAVAIGIVYEMEYAYKHGYTGENELNLIKNILQYFGYDTLYKPTSIENMRKALSKDKKANKHGVSLALTGENMQGKIVDNISVNELLELF